MSYPASIIAYAFVKRGIDEGMPITQMKLQKVLYFAHGLHLAMNNKEPLLKEHFQSWKYGPVIPDIYSEYKFCGSHPITDTSCVLFSEVIDHDELIEALDLSAKKTISLTWDNTKDIDAFQLSNWTHSPGSPWHKHYKEGVTDINIPNDDIYNYFIQFIKNDK